MFFFFFFFPLAHWIEEDFYLAKENKRKTKCDEKYFGIGLRCIGNWELKGEGKG